MQCGDQPIVEVVQVIVEVVQVMKIKKNKGLRSEP